MSPSDLGLILASALFRYAHKEGTDHFAIFTDERSVIGLVVSTENCRWPGIGAFCDKGLISCAIMVELRPGSGLSLIH